MWSIHTHDVSLLKDGTSDTWMGLEDMRQSHKGQMLDDSAHRKHLK